MGVAIFYKNFILYKIINNFFKIIIFCKNINAFVKAESIF